MFTASPSSSDGDYIDLQAALGKLLVVRPLEYRTDFKTTFSPEGTDVVFCDIAVVDDVDPQTGKQGRVYRDQAILQGFLKGTFKRRVGDMIVGMLYLGPKNNGRPPYMWHDLIEDANARARAEAWVTANQSFCVRLSSSAPAQVAPQYQPPAPAAPAPPRPLTPAQYAAPVSATPVSPGMPQLTTLQSYQQMNHQGQPQQENPPF